MTQSGTKKSESIEVRLTHEAKQAFMTKAAVEGSSASEIVRRSIADYLHRRSNEHRLLEHWKLVAVCAVAAMVFGFAYSAAFRATANPHRTFEAARARLNYDCTDPAHKRVTQRFAKEFASQRLLITNPGEPGMSRRAFSHLDLDCDGRLALNEYRQLSIVPAGEEGRKLFQSHDHDRDGWIEQGEFILKP